MDRKNHGKRLMPAGMPVAFFTRQPLVRCIVIGCVAISCTALVSCSLPQQPQMSALAVRTMQSREFPRTEPADVLKAALNVLQDEGFVVQESAPAIGLLTARKEIDLQRDRSPLFQMLFNSPDASWPKLETIETTVTVSAIGSESRARLSMVRRVIDNNGRVLSVEEVRDPVAYRDLLGRIDKSLFLVKERI